MKFLPERPKPINERFSLILPVEVVCSKMSTEKNVSEDWLLVHLHNGGRDVVNVKVVKNPVNMKLKTGDALTMIRRGGQEQATLIARARDRSKLTAMLVKQEDVAGPSGLVKAVKYGEKFSSIASDWVLSWEAFQSRKINAKIKVRNIKSESNNCEYSGLNSKSITHSYKTFVVPVSMKRKRPFQDTTDLTSFKSYVVSTKNKQTAAKLARNPNSKKSVVVSKKSNQIVPKKAMNLSQNNILADATNSSRSIDPNYNDIKIRDDSSQTFYKVLKDMNEPRYSSESVKHEGPTQQVSPNLTGSETRRNSNTHLNISMDKYKENANDRVCISDSEKLNRSYEKVHINYKYDNSSFGAKIGYRIVKEDEEWIPIGSGMTLIPREKYMTINWKFYTVATRTLLLAVFDKNILATHSLTGKRSPAFQHKPAKLCLDMRKTSDVIIEIMSRFNVQENLVRSIITTKCADEAKMLKARIKKNENCSENNENCVEI